MIWKLKEKRRLRASFLGLVQDTFEGMEGQSMQRKMEIRISICTRHRILLEGLWLLFVQVSGQLSLS